MDPKDRAVFLSELDRALIEFLFKTSTNPLRKMFGLLIPTRRRAHVASQRCMGICYKMIHNYRNNLETPTPDTIIDRIMTSDTFQNDTERAAELLIFLIAGHDTTGNSLAWILLELARNPSELEKVRSTFVSTEVDQWSKSDAIKRVVKEGMRLHPVASSGSIRTIGREMIVPGKNGKNGKNDMLLPKGSIVFLSYILMLRNPEIYDDADSFAPSRWENPTVEQTSAFLPFGMGEQNCAGQSLANAEIHCIIARIASEYDFDIVDQGEAAFFMTLRTEGTKLLARKASGTTAH